MKALSWSIAAVILLGLPLGGSYWFNRQYVGWLVESVPDANAFLEQWQASIDHYTAIDHPAVIHWLPNDCLCRVLTSKHAAQVSELAIQNNFHVYQLKTSDEALGNVIDSTPVLSYDVRPTIIITAESGQITYVGAYSNSVRCSSSTSMVDAFIRTPLPISNLAVVGLDVKTCRCTR